MVRVFLLLSVIFGLAWGWLRQPYHIIVGDNDELSFVAGSDSVEFSNFATYYICVLVLAIGLGLVTIFRNKKDYTIGGLLFIGFLSSLGSALVWWIGKFVGAFHYPSINLDSIPSGEIISVLPSITPGTTIIIVPAISMTLYWSAALTQYWTARYFEKDNAEQEAAV